MANFTSSDCGSYRGRATSDTGLNPGGEVTINGKTDLSSCIVGPDKAAVFSIKLGKSSSPIYDYVVTVDAQGPTGYTEGLTLTFIDGTKGSFNLTIYSSNRGEHVVRYNSENPAIREILWTP